MAEDVGSLRVSLSLDTAEFAQSMQDVSRKLRAVRSEFSASSNGTRTYANSIEGLRAKSTNLTRQLELQRAKVQTLRRRYEEVSASQGANSRAAENLLIQYNRAQGALGRMEAELEQVNERLRIQSSRFYQMGQSLQNAGERMKKIGQSMSEVGRSMSMMITGPLVAIGGSAAKAAIDFESAFAGVKKTVNASNAEFKQMETSIRDMAKSIPASTEEISHVAEAAGQLGIKKEAIMGFTRTMVDLGVATNMTSDQAATDLARLANITQMPQSQFDRLGSTIVALGNNFATTESEITAMSLRLAGTGKQVGLSEHQIMALATAMSSVGIEAEAGGTAMSTIMKKINTAVMTGGKGMEAFAKTAGMSSAQFTKAWKTDAVSALDAFIKGLANAHAQGKDVSDMLNFMHIKGIREQDTLLRLSGASNVLADALGVAANGWKENVALSNEAEQRYKTTESQLKILWNKLKDVGITLGQALLPAIIDVVDSLQPFIQKIANLAKWFADLSPGMQKVVLTLAAIAVAVGPVLIVVGSLISSVGAIATAMGALATSIGIAGGAAGLLSAALGVIIGPIGLTIAAVAALGVGVYALVKHFKKSSMEANVFSDNISKGTKKAVGSFLDLNKKATEELHQLEWSGDAVTKSTASKIVSNFNQMGDQMLAGLKKHHQQELSTMQQFFANSTILSDKDKQDTLNKMNEKYTQQSKAVTNGESIIKGILEKASKEKRSLTEDEKIQINNIQEGMVTNGIKYLSKNELESKSILERMKAQAGEISAQQAADVVQNSKKQTDEAVKAANQQYDKVVKEIIRQRDEVGSISEEQANKMILDAKLQRDKVVGHAQDLHKNVVSEAKKQAGEHADQVNWETGEVLNKWEMLKVNTKRKFSEIRQSISQKWDEIKQNTLQKWDEIKAWPGKKIDEMKVSVGNKMIQVKNTVSDEWQKAEDYLSSIDLKQIGIDIIQGLINGITAKAKALWDKVKSIGDSIGDALRGALDSHSPSRVTMSIGNDVGDGLMIGMNERIKGIVQQANAMAKAAIPSIGANNNPVSSTPSYGSIPAGTSFNQINNFYSPKALTPSETARQNQRVLQQMAFAFRR